MVFFAVLKLSKKGCRLPTFLLDDFSTIKTQFIGVQRGRLIIHDVEISDSCLNRSP